jgi:hypothetical protein
VQGAQGLGFIGQSFSYTAKARTAMRTINACVRRVPEIDVFSDEGDTLDEVWGRSHPKGHGCEAPPHASTQAAFLE